MFIKEQKTWYSNNTAISTQQSGTWAEVCQAVSVDIAWQHFGFMTHMLFELILVIECSETFHCCQILCDSPTFYSVARFGDKALSLRSCGLNHTSITLIRHHLSFPISIAWSSVFLGWSTLCSCQGTSLKMPQTTPPLRWHGRWRHDDQNTTYKIESSLRFMRPCIKKSMPRLGRWLCG